MHAVSAFGHDIAGVENGDGTRLEKTGELSAIFDEQLRVNRIVSHQAIVNPCASGRRPP